MKGDIAFVGFMLTADEWQALDPQSRAQLIAVATRRADPVFDPPRRFPDGTGKHEIVESIDDELDELLELDAELIAEDVLLIADDAFTFDATAEYDALEEWLALQPAHDDIDHDEWVDLPPVAPYVPRADADAFENFSDWDF